MKRAARIARFPSRTPAAALLVVILAGCGPASDDARSGGADASTSSAADSAAAAISRLAGELPSAAFVRFQETSGEGLSRTSWEVEILQTDTDIWLKGSTRASGRSIPFKESMSIEQFSELWEWLRDQDLDDLRLVEDSTAAPAPWRKSLVVDIVQAGHKRTRTRNAWTRPLAGHPEILELEKRMKNLLVESSERELHRMQAQAAADSASRAEDRAEADSARAGLPPAGMPDEPNDDGGTR